MKHVIEWISEHLIALTVTLVIIAVSIGIGAAAYAHRVIEFKDFPATATVTGTRYEPGHYETVYHVDARGNSSIENVWRDPVYGLQYDVNFEGTIYPFYQTVSENTFYAYRTGDTIPATFRREWRADGSETYSIYLN